MFASIKKAVTCLHPFKVTSGFISQNEPVSAINLTQILRNWGHMSDSGRIKSAAYLRGLCTSLKKKTVSEVGLSNFNIIMDN